MHYYHKFTEIHSAPRLIRLDASPENHSSKDLLLTSVQRRGCEDDRWPASPREPSHNLPMSSRRAFTLPPAD